MIKKYINNNLFELRSVLISETWNVSNIFIKLSLDWHLNLLLTEQEYQQLPLVNIYPRKGQQWWDIPFLNPIRIAKTIWRWRQDEEFELTACATPRYLIQLLQTRITTTAHQRHLQDKYSTRRLMWRMFKLPFDQSPPQSKHFMKLKNINSFRRRAIQATMLRRGLL